MNPTHANARTHPHLAWSLERGFSRGVVRSPSVSEWLLSLKARSPEGVARALEAALGPTLEEVQGNPKEYAVLLTCLSILAAADDGIDVTEALVAANAWALKGFPVGTVFGGGPPVLRRGEEMLADKKWGNRHHRTGPLLSALADRCGRYGPPRQAFAWLSVVAPDAWAALSMGGTRSVSPSMSGVAYVRALEERSGYRVTAPLLLPVALRLLGVAGVIIVTEREMGDPRLVKGESTQFPAGLPKRIPRTEMPNEPEVIEILIDKMLGRGSDDAAA